jgi:hypothetical protein
MNSTLESTSVSRTSISITRDAAATPPRLALGRTHHIRQPRFLLVVQAVGESAKLRADEIDCLPQGFDPFAFAVDLPKRSERGFRRARCRQRTGSAVHRSGQLVQFCALTIRKNHTGFDLANGPGAQSVGPTLAYGLCCVTGKSGDARTLRLERSDWSDLSCWEGVFCEEALDMYIATRRAFCSSFNEL